jgi:hypothetical protein
MASADLDPGHRAGDLGSEGHGGDHPLMFVRGCAMSSLAPAAPLAVDQQRTQLALIA